MELPSRYIPTLQKNLLTIINDNNSLKLSKMNRRALVIPINLIDASLESIRLSIKAIECVARAVIYCLRAPFNGKTYTIPKAIVLLEHALCSPIRLILIPPKLFYNLYTGLTDPDASKPIHFFNAAAEDD